MAWNRPSLVELIRRVSSDIASRSRVGRVPRQGSVDQVFGEVVAGASHMMHGHIDYGIAQMLVTTATGEGLDRHAQTWLVQTRKAAFVASGVVLLKGTLGAVVPKGLVLQRADGLNFKTRSEAVFLSESLEVPIIAELSGMAHNTMAGTELSLQIPLLGVQSTAIVSPQGVSGGANIESDEDLRARILKRLRNPPMGGADADYEIWAEEMPGVTRSWARALQMGLGTVTVVVIRDNDPDPIPSEHELGLVKAHIEAVRPTTARVYVIAPIPKPVDYKIFVSPNTPEVKAAVSESLRNFHLREADLEATLYLSRIQEAISLAAGEYVHVLHEPAENVVCGQNEIAVVGEIEWVD